MKNLLLALETTPTPSVEVPIPTTVVDAVSTVATADYTQLLTDIGSKLDMLTGLVLFIIGVTASLLVLWLLYKVIDNFVSY